VLWASPLLLDFWPVALQLGSDPVVPDSRDFVGKKVLSSYFHPESEQLESFKNSREQLLILAMRFASSGPQFNQLSS
jgi:hypothetical protein